MPQAIEKYKVVRRGPKWCVRVKGVVDTRNAQQWCMERNINGLGKSKYGISYTWENMTAWEKRWDYDFIFDEKKEALTFILGYL
jgi:hypothetical protein